MTTREWDREDEDTTAVSWRESQRLHSFTVAYTGEQPARRESTMPSRDKTAQAPLLIGARMYLISLACRYYWQWRYFQAFQKRCLACTRTVRPHSGSLHNDDNAGLLTAPTKSPWSIL